MMSPEQRAQAMAMLGQGGAQQAAQAVDPRARMQQMQMMEQQAMGQEPPQGMPPQGAPTGQAQQQIPPGLIQQILMMLRGGGQPGG